MFWSFIKPNKKTLSIFILVMFLSCLKTSAYTVTELQQKITETNQTKSSLEKEISAYENQLKEVGEEKDTLQSALKTLEINSKKMAADIKLNQNKISATTLRIEELSNNIGEKEVKIDSNLDTISFSLREMDREGDRTALESLLSGQQFSTVWNKIETINRFQDSLEKQTGEVKQSKTVLESNKTEAEKKKQELVVLKNQLLDKQKILAINTKEKSTLLAQTKNQESNYKKLLADRKAKMEAFEKELLAYESELKMVIDPNSIPKAKKGLLAWPLDVVRITQLFGKTSASGRLYASGLHNGVDFGAPIGTPVRATADGVIWGTGDTDVVCAGASYGKWVLIKYNNGLTSVYGHMSLIISYAGQTVKEGQVIGYSGSTGYSTGPHLHVSILATQGVKVGQVKSKVCNGIYTQPLIDPKAYLDPMQYFQ